MDARHPSFVARVKHRLRSSVRAKLLALVLLPIGLILPMLVLILAVWGGDAFDRLLKFKVHSDLTVAEGYFERVRGGVSSNVQMVAASQRLAAALADDNPATVTSYLREARNVLRLDVLQLLDRNGRLLAGAGALPDGTDQARWPVVQDAMELRTSNAIDVFPRELLSAIDADLALRAAIPLIPTRNAAAESRSQETRGLMMHAAAPVVNRRGELVAVLQGAQMLNRNLDFVDRINAIVYPQGSLLGESNGTATIFLGDVRVATNVRLFQSERAIGTRVSQAVRDAALLRGETWLDRAFVVNDWYVSGYRPIIDSFGERVGMLYVGFLEAPFQTIKRNALLGVGLLFAVTILLATLISLRAASRIFRPLEKMNATITAIDGGQSDARVGAVDSADEIGRLAGQFDQLLDQLQARNRALQEWAESLDAKVDARTRDLKAVNVALATANQSLKSAQRQLVISEKLAAIGQLTAGVTHEINNPVAVIQGNLDLMREILGDAAAPVKEEMRLIDDQIERIRLIVTKLLQFAQPTEFAGYLEPVEIRALTADSLLLVGHLLRRQHIAVAREIHTRRSVMINENELQQILINLMVNAIQAMGEGGTLTVSARDWDEADFPRGVTISVRDTGPGIAPENLDRIFNPFFTTKRGQGTGLGLAISYGLIERYGGRIDVESTPGQGACFTVWVPCEPLVPEAGKEPFHPTDHIASERG